MSSEDQYVKLDPRMYEYVRKSAIGDLTDAIVELATNSFDAYLIKNTQDKKNIEINVTQTKLIVKDDALGMLIDNMKKCFLTVGSYTAGGELSRGHFSRGAKDISALGDVTFTGIKDGLIAQCRLDYDCKCHILIEDKEVTSEERTKYDISSNGLHVELNFKNYDVTSWQYDELQYYYSLRDIFSDDSYVVNFKHYDMESSKRLVYQLPEGNKLAEIVFKIPTYENAEAKFELFEINHVDNFNNNANMKFSENGILISSDNSIYENTLLNNTIMRNKYSERFFGRIHCNYIKTLLIKYDNDGPTSLNPMPIIDPSRLTGLNKSHPFVGHLFNVPIKRIEFILSEKFRNQQNEDLKTLNEILNDLKDLQFIGDDIFNHLDINFDSEENILSLNPVDLEKYEETKNDENILQDEEIEPDSESDADEEDPDEENLNDLKILKKKNINKVHINFVDDETIPKFTTYYDTSGVYINISMRHPGLKLYMDPDSKDSTKFDNFNEINRTEVRMILAEILVEAFAKIVAENELKNINIEGMIQEEVFNLIEKTNEKYYIMYSQKVYDILFRNVTIDNDPNIITDN